MNHLILNNLTYSYESQTEPLFENLTLSIGPGCYTEGLKEEQREILSRRREYEKSRLELRHLEREASQRRALAASQQKRWSKNGLAIKDHDSRFKKNLARFTGKDGTGGKLLRQMDGRLTRAKTRMENNRVSKGRKEGFSLPGVISGKSILFHIDSLELPMGNERRLYAEDLSLPSTTKAALIGPNGSGKTTFLEHLNSHLRTTSLRWGYIPQEISAERAKGILNKVLQLNTREKGEILSTVYRLGSDPEKILETALPSPGELRKILLSLLISEEQELLILDEPTNHLDITSLHCLEEVLSDFPSAMIVVSHDRPFLKKVYTEWWEIDEGMVRRSS